MSTDNDNYDALEARVTALERRLTGLGPVLRTIAERQDNLTAAVNETALILDALGFTEPIDP